MISLLQQSTAPGDLVQPPVTRRTLLSDNPHFFADLSFSTTSLQPDYSSAGQLHRLPA